MTKPKPKATAAAEPTSTTDFSTMGVEELAAWFDDQALSPDQAEQVEGLTAINDVEGLRNVAAQLSGGNSEEEASATPVSTAGEGEAPDQAVEAEPDTGGGDPEGVPGTEGDGPVPAEAPDEAPAGTGTDDLDEDDDEDAFGDASPRSRLADADDETHASVEWIGAHLADLTDDDRAFLDDAANVDFILDNAREIKSAMAAGNPIPRPVIESRLPGDFLDDIAQAPLEALVQVAITCGLPWETRATQLPIEDQLTYFRALCFAAEEHAPLPSLRGLDLVPVAPATQPTPTAGPGSPAAVEVPDDGEAPLPPDTALGLNVGMVVKALPEDAASVWYGHVGVIDRIDLTEAGPSYIVRFHSGDQDPGERVPRGFARAELIVVNP